MRNGNEWYFSELFELSSKIIQNMLAFRYNFGCCLNQVISIETIIAYKLIHTWKKIFCNSDFIGNKFVPAKTIFDASLVR